MKFVFLDYLKFFTLFVELPEYNMVTLTVTSDCLLENISLSFEQELKQRLTIDNPKYLAAKKYGRWIGNNLKPTLRYYEVVADGLRFPRGYSNQAVLLCRELTGESPQIIDKRRLLEPVAISFHGELRAYQQEAVARVAGRSFGVLEAGTGSGKTVMALAIIAQRRQPTLVVVHTKELLYQWQERVQTFLHCEPGLIGDGNFDVRPVTIAIVNTARKRVQELIPQFGHLVVDECHRVPAALFTDVVANFDCQYLLGLSATAFRNDEGLTRLIYYFMGDRIHQVDRFELQATGAILKPLLIRRKTQFTYGYRGDYQALIKALTRHQGRNLQITEDIIKVANEPDSGTSLVVSDRVSHCELFVRLLADRSVEVAMLTGQLAPEKRTEIVEQVRSGKVQVLVATLQLISEGFDCPGLATLFLTTPITFEGRLLQVIGRIMRPAVNKQARVFDYVDTAVKTLNRSADIRRNVLSSL